MPLGTTGLEPTSLAYDAAARAPLRDARLGQRGRGVRRGRHADAAERHARRADPDGVVADGGRGRHRRDDLRDERARPRHPGPEHRRRRRDVPAGERAGHPVHGRDGARRRDDDRRGRRERAGLRRVPDGAVQRRAVRLPDPGEDDGRCEHRHPACLLHRAREQDVRRALRGPARGRRRCGATSSRRSTRAASGRTRGRSRRVRATWTTTIRTPSSRSRATTGTSSGARRTSTSGAGSSRGAAASSTRRSRPG